MPEPEDSLEADQLRLDELMNDSPDDRPDSEEEIEARLSKVRQERIEHFAKQRLKEAGGFKLAGEEEDNDPAEEAEEFEDIELEDYTSYADTEAVQSELAYRRRTGWIVLALSGVLEGVLLWLTVLAFLTPALPIDSIWYLSIHLFVLGVMLVLNHRMVGGRPCRTFPDEGGRGYRRVPGFSCGDDSYRPAVYEYRGPCGGYCPADDGRGGLRRLSRFGRQTDAHRADQRKFPFRFPSGG